MIFIKIGHSEPNVPDMINYIDHVAMLIAQGWTKGDGWEIIQNNDEQTDGTNNQTTEPEESMEEVHQSEEYLEE